jgi:hypothetical protein
MNVIKPELRDAFRYHLQTAGYWYDNGRAVACLDKARKDIAEGKKRYPRQHFGMRGGADWKLGSDTVFFCEDTATYLRNERDALQVIAAASYRSPRHTGYYMSPDNWTGEIARGVVFQLPGKNRAPRYISGIADSWSGAAHAAIISPEIFDDETDAARNADALADRYAEQERDYQEAWQAGQRFAELGAEIAEERKTALATLAKYRTHKPEFETERRALIAAYLETRETLSDKRDELESNFGRCDAFNEGRNN